MPAATPSGPTRTCCPRRPTWTTRQASAPAAASRTPRIRMWMRRWPSSSTAALTTPPRATPTPDSGTAGAQDGQVDSALALRGPLRTFAGGAPPANVSNGPRSSLIHGLASSRSLSPSSAARSLVSQVVAHAVDVAVGRQTRRRQGTPWPCSSSAKPAISAQNAGLWLAWIRCVSSCRST